MSYNGVNLTPLTVPRARRRAIEPPQQDASAVDEAGAASGDAGASRLGEDRILAAARGILVEEGLEALSMRRVASQVGVSATAIYHYFDNKRELVDRLVGTTFRRIETYLRDAAESCPEGSLERLRALEEGYIDFALEHEQYFRALFALRSERLRAMEDHPAQGCYHLLSEAVYAAMEADNLEARDPDEVVLYLWSAVHGLVALSLACKLEVPPGGRRVGARELFDSSWSMMLDGLRAGSGGCAASRPDDAAPSGESA